MHSFIIFFLSWLDFCSYTQLTKQVMLLYEHHDKFNWYQCSPLFFDFHHHFDKVLHNISIIIIIRMKLLIDSTTTIFKNVNTEVISNPSDWQGWQHWLIFFITRWPSAHLGVRECCKSENAVFKDSLGPISSLSLNSGPHWGGRPRVQSLTSARFWWGRLSISWKKTFSSKSFQTLLQF